MLKLQPRLASRRDLLSFPQTKPQQIKELFRSQMPTGSYVGFSSGESHCVTGRLRWEVGGNTWWTLLRRLYALLHTASLHSSSCLSAPCVVDILFHLGSIQTPFCWFFGVFWGGFVSTSLTTNAVQQGDIERASLQRENKQFVIRCNQGQRLLPPSCTEHSRRCK